VGNNERLNKRRLMSIMLLGLLIRIFLAPITKGHSTDVLCFSYWADFVASKGISNFYTSDIFVDYPPAYIYILFLIGKVQHLFSVSMTSHYMLFLIKLPAIIADVLLGYIIYRVAKPRVSNKKALIITSLYIFNPAIIINSSVWAQIDGFYTLFIALFLLSLYENKLSRALVIYTVSILIKPQSLIFAPILICVFLQKREWRNIIKAIVFSGLTAIIIILPFTGSQKLLWIVDKYKATLSSYPYASINAFNLFSLSKGNWVSYKESFFYLDYKTWGTIFIVFITLFSIYIYLKGKEKHKLFYIAYFIVNAVFVLSAKMHERYVFPALALGLMLYIYSKEFKILLTFIVASLTHFINVAYVLRENNMGRNFIENGNLCMNIVAVINIILLLSIIIIGWNMYCKESTSEIICKKLNISKKDLYAIVALIAIYSIIALINLGSVKVPETYWQPKEKGESIIADLGDVKELDRIYYFPGIVGGKYKVYVSLDKNLWQEAGEFTGENIYLWKYINMNLEGRYVKISCSEEGGRLNEVGIFQKGSHIPVTLTSDEKNNIFDEQATVTYSPSYLKGMYFDEIYHARTAYEHLNRMRPYEWTHPPLGKIFISIGIFLFGMNPFGWRIVGTLIGIAMIPMMYLFALKIFKKSKLAFITAFLISFDFMHFSQTRIATIDVYAVFFVILMYYFMYQFVSRNFYDKEFKSSLKYFMLSGISFGLGAASKWSCLYGGAGLAIILLSYIIFNYIEIKKLHKKLKLQEEEIPLEKLIGMKKIFGINVRRIILYGIVFFILIPIVIYILSYIPYLLVPGSRGLIEILDYQKSMYEYHSTLVATHPFASPWWEWPLIIRPIWYYTGQGYIASGKVSSIVSMGNPAIWWTGIVTMILTLIITVKERDKKGAFILIAIASQYVPWMLVPRLIFIYHYFATVPFMILSIVYVFQWINKKWEKAYTFIGAYLILVLVLFIMFYPIMSGLTVDKSYVANFLRWFKTWYFYS
jgi:Gpi18-like mannosyltransferase